MGWGLGINFTNPQDGSLELGSAQVNRAVLTARGPPAQQGREATEFGARRSWQVCGCSLSPGYNMNESASGLQTEVPSDPSRVTHCALGADILKNALRGVGLRAWLSDPSLFSGPHPVTANSLDLFHPADQGCLHSHVTEVVSAVTESTEIVPKAVCVSVSAGRRGLVW